ncbi:MAG TPA: TIGR00269 family protein [candidate division Zixibacteria bacterium]|nr:TIGR00269 family protein [candidate division Zixibacteria bacterium]
MEKSIPTCYNCSKLAVTFRRIDGRHLCKDCFSKWVLKIVRKTIRSKDMFGRNDRIIVGLSGGKDSTVLLDILAKVEKKFPSKIIAVCIDEGIKGYREDGLPIAKMNAERLDIEYHQFSFKDLFGYSLDEVVIRSRELQQKLPLTRQTKIIQHGACSYCGVFRRKALNFAARKLDGDKVATGHNLSDVSQTILLNLLRGDSTKLLRGDLKPEKVHDSFVPRVKPLQAVAERDVVLYAFYNDINYHTTECPYSIEAMRLDVRNFLAEIEEKYPGTQHSIRNSMETIIEKFEKLEKPAQKTKTDKIDQMPLCKICSEPTSNNICKGCQMLEVLFKNN